MNQRWFEDDVWTVGRVFKGSDIADLKLKLRRHLRPRNQHNLQELWSSPSSFWVKIRDYHSSRYILLIIFPDVYTKFQANPTKQRTSSHAPLSTPWVSDTGAQRIHSHLPHLEDLWIWSNKDYTEWLTKDSAHTHKITLGSLIMVITGSHRTCRLVVTSHCWDQVPLSVICY